MMIIRTPIFPYFIYSLTHSYYIGAKKVFFRQKLGFQDKGAFFQKTTDLRHNCQQFFSRKFFSNTGTLFRFPYKTKKLKINASVKNLTINVSNGKFFKLFDVSFFHYPSFSQARTSVLSRNCSCWKISFSH